MDSQPTSNTAHNMLLTAHQIPPTGSKEARYYFMISLGGESWARLQMYFILEGARGGGGAGIDHRQT